MARPADEARIRRVAAGPYYMNWSGHPYEDLAHLVPLLRGPRDRSVIWLAGDSSLDNKYWVHGDRPAVNGFEHVLQPPKMKPDVCYSINEGLVDRKMGDNIVCINAAVEASTLDDRQFCTLEPQDRLIRDHIREDDVLIVSVGGNDIALSPLLCTALNLLMMSCLVPQSWLNDSCACACPPDLHLPDCGCVCCGIPDCLLGLLGCPPGFGYFVQMFKNRVAGYVRRLISKCKPRLVLVSMIYLPDQKGSGWSDAALGLLQYDRNPSRLGRIIRYVYEHGTRQIKLPGTAVVPMPLFEIMDGTNSEDYVERVEPSVEGGRKMANAFLDAILEK